MKKGKMFWSILKSTYADRFVYGFLVYFFISSFIIMLAEPGIHRYGEAVWYSFSVITTIGFGDFAAVTVIGRAASILLGLYGVIILAMIPGIVTSYYMEVMKMRTRESAEVFLYQLEHLEELSEEELKELSEKIKNRKIRIK